MARIPGPVLITGGSGFIGVGVAEALLAANPGLEVVLTDIVDHPRRTRLGDQVRFVVADLTDPSALAGLFAGPAFGTVFHFASLVSGGAERDFDLGMRVNLYATLALLEACRAQGGCPRFVFTSSIATFGGGAVPAVCDDYTHQHPQNSYGVAKVVAEQLINDYSRKGFLDGRAVRLAAIVIRDEPNTAASGYASGLAREPLAGRDYVCPVTPETRLPLLSVRACIACLVDLAALPAGALGDFRAINSPAIAPSAAEIAATVGAWEQDHPVGQITFAPDPQVMDIVRTWPRSLRADRARDLGLVADADYASIIRDYLASDG